MLHLIYILAFTIIAVLAVTNLVRSLITLSTETQRVYPQNYNKSSSSQNSRLRNQVNNYGKVHPELLDNQGKKIDEPLLVMRSISVEDARQKLDALYNQSPNKGNEPKE
ncbi:MAG: DUF2973 domain-containing protein [Xenococcaceae cyanobacterium MO_207.B15]|nr:DUF2973 domain-containing protein [Xenococcaceae cyanobacterium MO_207.B15]MDJ0744986.1 DUF2973 domain-containing protein [Xenococcaceae cyanobacterium MO_167.B27]